MSIMIHFEGKINQIDMIHFFKEGENEIKPKQFKISLIQSK